MRGERRMKKLIGILATSLIVLLIMSGCQKENASSDQFEQKQEDQNEQWLKDREKETAIAEKEYISWSKKATKKVEQLAEERKYKEAYDILTFESPHDVDQSLNENYKEVEQAKKDNMVQLEILKDLKSLADGLEFMTAEYTLELNKQKQRNEDVLIPSKVLNECIKKELETLNDLPFYESVDERNE